VLHWCESLHERLLVELGGHRAGTVAYYSWSLPVPRRLGDCVSMEHARRIVQCSRVGFVRGF
jgi:hypothetical protein